MHLFLWAWILIKLSILAIFVRVALRQVVRLVEYIMHPFATEE